MIDWTEFGAGLRETRRYLLSHHEPSEWYRCYAPTLFGRRVHVCARCSGIYPGILAGLLVFLLGPEWASSLALVAVVPLPALADWGLTTFTGRRGYNPARTASGLLLGYGYGIGLGLLFVGRDPRVLAVGVVYAVVAGSLLAVRRTAR